MSVSTEAEAVSLSIAHLWQTVIINLVWLLLVIWGMSLAYPAETSGFSGWKPSCKVKFQIFSYATGTRWDRLTVLDIRAELLSLARLVSALYPAQGDWVCLEHEFFSPQENLQKIRLSAGKYGLEAGKSRYVLDMRALKHVSDTATTAAPWNMLKSSRRSWYFPEEYLEKTQWSECFNLPPMDVQKS